MQEEELCGGITPGPGHESSQMDIPSGAWILISPLAHIPTGGFLGPLSGWYLVRSQHWQPGQSWASRSHLGSSQDWAAAGETRLREDRSDSALLGMMLTCEPSPPRNHPLELTESIPELSDQEYRWQSCHPCWFVQTKHLSQAGLQQVRK